MRATVSSLVMGGVPQLGPGYAGGFSLGGLLGGIGRVAGALIGLPPRATGPNAGVLSAPMPNTLFGGIGPAIAGGVASTVASGFPKIVKQTFPFSPAGLLGIGGAAGGARRRRLNPLNLRALGRADRRLEAFAKIARRYVSPTAPQRVVRTKRRKR